MQVLIKVSVHNTHNRELALLHTMETGLLVTDLTVPTVGIALMCGFLSL